MIKWYFIKLLPVFIWILSQQHLYAANGVAVDAVNEDDTQVKAHIPNTFNNRPTKMKLPNEVFCLAWHLNKSFEIDLISAAENVPFNGIL